MPHLSMLVFVSLEAEMFLLMWKLGFFPRLAGNAVSKVSAKRKNDSFFAFLHQQ
jgi:hypothetical protein